MQKIARQQAPRRIMSEGDQSIGSTGTDEFVDSNVGAPRVPEAATTAGYAPEKPKFGGLRETGTNTLTPWVGGKPKADFTELEEASPTFIQATQYRPTSITARTKGQHYRTTGLEPKFKRDGDIQAFQRLVMDHLEDYGMDTITYLKDPGNPKKVITVIKEHGKFNLKKGMQGR